MKLWTKIVALVVLVAVSVVVAGGRFRTAEDAGVNCREIQSRLNNGYWMESCAEQPIYYLVPPTGTYEWGVIKSELRCDPSLGEPPVSMTCSIVANSKNGKMTYRESGNVVIVPIR